MGTVTVKKILETSNGKENVEENIISGYNG